MGPNIANFFSFYFNFFGKHFVTKAYLHFWNRHKILNFCGTQYYLFQEKKIHLSEGPFSKILDTNPKIKKKPLNRKKNTFCKTVLETFVPIPKYLRHWQLQKSLTLQNIQYHTYKFFKVSIKKKKNYSVNCSNF